MAVDAAQNQSSRHAPEVFSILSELTHLQYCYTGDYTRTEPAVRRSMSLHEGALGSEHPDLWRDYVALGYALEHGGRPDEADTAFRRAAALAERSLGPRHADTIAARGQLYQNLRNARKYSKLEKLLRPLVETDDLSREVLPHRSRLWRRCIASRAAGPKPNPCIGGCSRRLNNSLCGLNRSCRTHSGTRTMEG
jgi:hypothetical protein